MKSAELIPIAFEWDKDNTGPAGWYAVAVVWDENEGISPGAAHWNGSSWDDARPIGAFAGPFGSEAAATAWAYEHDPEL